MRYVALFTFCIIVMFVDVLTPAEPSKPVPVGIAPTPDEVMQEAINKWVDKYAKDLHHQYYVDETFYASDLLSEMLPTIIGRFRQAGWQTECSIIPWVANHTTPPHDKKWHVVIKPRKTK